MWCCITFLKQVTRKISELYPMYFTMSMDALVIQNIVLKSSKLVTKYILIYVYVVWWLQLDRLCDDGVLCVRESATCKQCVVRLSDIRVCSMGGCRTVSSARLTIAGVFWHVGGWASVQGTNNERWEKGNNWWHGLWREGGVKENRLNLTRMSKPMTWCVQQLFYFLFLIWEIS
jgi:hypothetical protein